jgi:DNA modification methylase
MPESVKDRPTKAHEYLFLFAKQPRYYYNAEAIAEPATQPIGAAQLTGQHKRAVLQDVKSSTLGTNAGAAYRNRRTVWSINTRAYEGAHFAVMPEALVEPCILAGSRPGDTVLDPFGGSGTVARVAERLQRDAVLIELNPGYIELAERRTDGVQVELCI